MDVVVVEEEISEIVAIAKKEAKVQIVHRVDSIAMRVAMEIQIAHRVDLIVKMAIIQIVRDVLIAMIMKEAIVHQDAIAKRANKLARTEKISQDVKFIFRQKTQLMKLKCSLAQSRPESTLINLIISKFQSLELDPIICRQSIHSRHQACANSFFRMSKNLAIRNQLQFKSTRFQLSMQSET